MLVNEPITTTDRARLHGWSRHWALAVIVSLIGAPASFADDDSDSDSDEKPKQALILSAQPDAENGTLLIIGEDLAKEEAPIVALGEQLLEVLTFSPMEVETVLPDVSPGTYLLVLLPDWGKGKKIATFDATIGAVGPDGPEGRPGAQGPPGPTGEDGEAGAPGEDGAPGPPGPKGMSWHGAWDVAAEYAIDDAVSHLGSAWIAVGESTGVEPVDGVDWALVALRGNPGAQGDPGDKGDRGDPGDPGLPGEAGPQGPPGPPGDSGEPGPPGLDGATWHSGGGAPPATLGVDGDFYLAQTGADLFRKTAGAWAQVATLEGPAGPPGASGPAGASVNIDGPSCHPGDAVIWNGRAWSCRDYVAESLESDPLAEVEITPGNGIVSFDARRGGGVVTTRDGDRLVTSSVEVLTLSSRLPPRSSQLNAAAVQLVGDGSLALTSERVTAQISDLIVPLSIQRGDQQPTLGPPGPVWVSVYEQFHSGGFRDAVSWWASQLKWGGPVTLSLSVPLHNEFEITYQFESCAPSSFSPEGRAFAATLRFECTLVHYTNPLRETLAQWLNETLAGNQTPRDLSVAPSDPKEGIPVTDLLQYGGCLLIRYSFPTAERRETIDVQAATLELMGRVFGQQP